MTAFDTRATAILETTNRPLAASMTAEWKAMVPPLYQPWRLRSHPHTNHAREAQRWANERPGDLIIAGPVGSGKTGLGVGILRVLHGQHVYAGMFNVTSTLTDSIDYEYFKSLRVLVIDDIGAFRHLPSEVHDALDLLIDYRKEHGFKTVFILGCEIGELREYMGAATARRIREATTTITMPKGDLRRAKG